MPEKFENFGADRNNTKEEIFKSYSRDLDLKPEDLEGKILDIGAGASEFAKWAKEHGVSDQIYSLDPGRRHREEKEKSVRGRADALPFEDQVFDLVISNSAIPNILGEEDREQMERDVRESVKEALRVLKSGGEIRLGRVIRNSNKDYQKDLQHFFDSVLGELVRKGHRVEMYHKKYADIYRKYEDGRKELSAESYLVKIKKPELK